MIEKVRENNDVKFRENSAWRTQSNWNFLIFQVTLLCVAASVTANTQSKFCRENFCILLLVLPSFSSIFFTIYGKNRKKIKHKNVCGSARYTQRPITSLMCDELWKKVGRRRNRNFQFWNAQRISTGKPWRCCLSWLFCSKQLRQNGVKKNPWNDDSHSVAVPAQSGCCFSNRKKKIREMTTATQLQY